MGRYSVRNSSPNYSSDFILHPTKCKSLGEFISGIEDKMLNALLDKADNIAYRDMRYSTAISLYAKEMDIPVYDVLSQPYYFRLALMSAVDDCILMERMYRDGESGLSCRDCWIMREVGLQIEINKLRYGAEEKEM